MLPWKVAAARYILPTGDAGASERFAIRSFFWELLIVHARTLRVLTSTGKAARRGVGALHLCNRSPHRTQDVDLLDSSLGPPPTRRSDHQIVVIWVTLWTLWRATMAGKPSSGGSPGAPRKGRFPPFRPRKLENRVDFVKLEVP